MHTQPDIHMPRNGKAYTALLSQSGTNDPTPQIITDTTTGITWQRLSAGQYKGTTPLNHLKTLAKGLGGYTNLALIPLFNTTPGDYYYTIQFATDDTGIQLLVYDDTGAYAELSTASAGFPILIDIIEYP